MSIHGRTWGWCFSTQPVCPGRPGDGRLNNEYAHWILVRVEESDLYALSLPMLGAQRPGLREVGTVGLRVLGQTRS